MTKANELVNIMSNSDAWNKSVAWQAQRIDRAQRNNRGYDYDKMEPDLGFIYFSDGSKCGVRPLSHQIWIP